MALIELDHPERSRLGLTIGQAEVVEPQILPPDENLPTFHSLWQHIQAGDTNEVVPFLSRPNAVYALDPLAGGLDRAPGFYTRAARARRQAKSGNWAGGVLFPSHGRRFYRVAGKWKVPAVGDKSQDDDPKHDMPGYMADGDSIGAGCSIWIGLDGYRRWADSMPQLGTEHIPNSDGSCTHRFWFQWWNPDSPVFQYYLTRHDGDDGPIDLQTGDTVTCHMQVLNVASPGDAVQFDFLRERAVEGQENMERVRATITMKARPKRPVFGGTAQAVLERSAIPYIDFDGKAQNAGLRAMPNFGTFQFCDFAAGARNGDDVREYTADRMQRIANFATRREPTRAATVARAKLIGCGQAGRALSLHYHA